MNLFPRGYQHSRLTKIQNHRFHEFAPIPTKDIQEDEFETVKDHEGVKVDQLPQPSKSQFEETSEVSGIALLVEGREIQVSKSVLMLHSPVFKTMFTADFKENNLKEIPHWKKRNMLSW